VYDETEPDTADKPVLGEKGRKYKKVNWMKAAFLSADKLLTVSPTYATEIAANESQGVELDGVIRCVCTEHWTHANPFDTKLLLLDSNVDVDLCHSIQFCRLTSCAEHNALCHLRCVMLWPTPHKSRSSCATAAAINAQQADMCPSACAAEQFCQTKP